MKKLAFVIESLHLGGAERSLVTLLQNIDYQKYQVDLVLFNKGGIFENSVPQEVSIIYNPRPPLNFFDRILFKLKRLFNNNKRHAAQLLWGIIGKKLETIPHSYDIAIAYNQGFTTYFTEKYLNANIKFAWLNTDYQKAGYVLDFDFPIYKSFKAIVAVSQEVKNGLREELKKTDRILRIEVIKDITDKTVIYKQSLDQTSIKLQSEITNIVTVGRLAEAKGIHLAVESCKILIDNGYSIHWYVVGEGPERKNIEILIAKYQLEKHFTLVGQTSNPYPYMKDCDIYVQTSLFEGLGLTVIEASYLNKPIVCTNFPTVYGILRDNETGLISEMNEKSIASKIQLLINDERLRHNLCSNLALQSDDDKEVTLQQFNHLMEEFSNA